MDIKNGHMDIIMCLSCCFGKKALYSRGVMKMHEVQKKQKNGTLWWENFYRKMWKIAGKIAGKMAGKIGWNTHYEE